MKLIHISDLHLGKKVCGFSMLEEQKDALKQVLKLAWDEAAEAILVAGDVYDKAIPSAEAVSLLDWFLEKAASAGIKILMISGNHDSAARLGFGSDLLKKSDVYISGEYDGTIPHVDLFSEDERGEVRLRVHMLPYIRPGSVRRFTDEEIETYDQAFAWALSRAERLEDGLNILMSHQFFAGARTCESEELVVGGLDQISTSQLAGFDYAALGHIHSPQRAGERGWYCGTLLKYSPSEAGQTKVITLLDVGPDSIHITKVPVEPLRDVVALKGKYEELSSQKVWKTLSDQDYYFVTLTDEQDIPFGFQKLQVFYPRLMGMVYENTRTKREISEIALSDPVEEKSPFELMNDFFEEMNGRPMDSEQKKMVIALLEEYDAAD